MRWMENSSSRERSARELPEVLLGPEVRRWTIEEPGGRKVVVRAGSWLVALGLGLEALGSSAELHRLVCEVLPQDKVIARDATRGHTWVVSQSNPSEAPEPRASGPLVALAGFALR